MICVSAVSCDASGGRWAGESVLCGSAREQSAEKNEKGSLDNEDFDVAAAKFKFVKCGERAAERSFLHRPRL